eukprot:CAMPEP_0183530474 /NCGR_PEP_ID=MMETSP0371-20130417/24136_1 /TAXON_ID=268820 /ORGANISM="Peridinium aciculiferum, Strain PAER-2" /LENGTH=64 /DNA_ID=CAMNT_0025730363 /DNA_START=472 /DNA_END=666 /DNA_ORIENTATION=+
MCFGTPVALQETSAARRGSLPGEDPFTFAFAFALESTFAFAFALVFAFAFACVSAFDFAMEHDG